MLDAFTNPVPVDVPDAVAALGISVTRTLSKEDSTELVSLCPAHEDRKPSFSINDISGFFNCFSCGYRGAFISLVEDQLGYSQMEAFQWITRRGLYHLYETDDASPKSSGLDRVEITEAHLALFTTPPADALAKRGLTAAACAAYGVLWDEAARRWVLPVREAGTGRLLGWQAKGHDTRYFSNHPGGLKKSRCVFGLEQLEGRDTATLVESPLDAVRLASLGERGAVSGYGAFVSEYQMRLLRVRVKTLILGLDNDTAGIGARDKLYARWRPRGLGMKFMAYDGIAAKDVGDMSDSQALWSVANARYPWQRQAGVVA